MHALTNRDVFGLVRPSTDAHTLGLLSFAQLLESCGVNSCLADDDVCREVEHLGSAGGAPRLAAWIRLRGVSALGFSYRLDPMDGAALCASLHGFLRREALFSAQGGPVKALYFAGLPEACLAARERCPDLAGTFSGDESPAEILAALGIPRALAPSALASGMAYDEDRLAFGASLVARGSYLDELPPDRSGCPGYGLRGERLESRIAFGIARGHPPLIRAHAGPYLPDRREAVKLFLDWTHRLARGGYLDVLSIGTSQLTQSAFGENWTERANGGGVPLASAEEFAEVWKAARPMLVRCYAGSKDVPGLAKMYESAIDIAWHALSFWWFSALDGRGPNPVMANLEEHFAALRFIAASGKPLEPNVPHHFAFRGSDDLGYVVSGYMAAKAAKLQGIRTLVLQIMLNTPKRTWGIQDLAKARSLLSLVRSLEDSRFKIFLQPRGGLDYFSPDPQRAKAQLAAVTALMDDIEPRDPTSPQIIHVVGYSEAVRLADPFVIEESAKLTLRALREYRALRREGGVHDMAASPEVAAREEKLRGDALALIGEAERLIPDTYSPRGLYAMLKAGGFALPWLTYCRDEFPAANIATSFVDGGMRAVDAAGFPLPIEARIEALRANLAARRGPAGGFHA